MPIASCSTAWAISTSCSSRTPRSPARALGIALTKRGKHLGEDIPMCGVPVHAADEYLQRLIAQGHRVAVCEQIEDPAEARKRGAKAVVRRDVVRLVTPGTLTEETPARRPAHNYPHRDLSARRGRAPARLLSRSPRSTSQPASCWRRPVSASDLAGELARLCPARGADRRRSGRRSRASRRHP